MLYHIEWEPDDRDAPYQSRLVRGIDRYAGTKHIPPSIVRWVRDVWLPDVADGAPGTLTMSIHRPTAIGPDPDTGWAVVEVGGDIIMSRTREGR